MFASASFTTTTFSCNPWSFVEHLALCQTYSTKVTLLPWSSMNTFSLTISSCGLGAYGSKTSSVLQDHNFFRCRAPALAVHGHTVYRSLYALHKTTTLYLEPRPSASPILFDSSSAFLSNSVYRDLHTQKCLVHDTVFHTDVQICTTILVHSTLSCRFSSWQFLQCALQSQTGHS